MVVLETTHITKLNVPAKPVEDMEKLDNDSGHT
jgi:hypothetical protein